MMNLSYQPDMKGTSVLITGAGRRIGASLALGLSHAGCTITLHYNHSASEVSEIAGKITESGGEARCIQADLSDSRLANALVQQAISLSGPLDVLINNASVFDDISFSDTTPESIHHNLAVNAVAPFLLGRSFSKQGRKGVIINLLDAMMMDYDSKHVPYHISKRVLFNLTRIMAVEFAPMIRVNAIAPGLILPPEGKNQEYLDNLKHTNPLHSHGSAQDVVDACIYLMNAFFVTGQTIFIDGGRNLRGRMYE